MAAELGLRLRVSEGLDSGGSVCRVYLRTLWVCLKGQPFVGGVILVLLGTPDKAVFQHPRSVQAARTFSMRSREICQVVWGL